MDMNFICHTHMQENEVSLHVSKLLGLEIKKEFSFEIQTKLTYTSFKPWVRSQLVVVC
jgi:hypothetical protein